MAKTLTKSHVTSVTVLIKLRDLKEVNEFFLLFLVCR